MVREAFLFGHLNPNGDHHQFWSFLKNVVVESGFKSWFYILECPKGRVIFYVPRNGVVLTYVSICLHEASESTTTPVRRYF